MTNKKQNGRPPQTERNQKIIADFKAGMTSDRLATKYNLTRGYVQKIASGLYAERDAQMREFYDSLKGVRSNPHTQSMGKVNTYTRKQA